MATEQRTSSKEAQFVASERVRHRGGMTAYVARGLFVHSAPQTVVKSVLGNLSVKQPLTSSGIRDQRYYFCGHEIATADMVSGNLPDNPAQKWHLCTGTGEATYNAHGV